MKTRAMLKDVLLDVLCAQAYHLDTLHRGGLFGFSFRVPVSPAATAALFSTKANNSGGGGGGGSGGGSTPISILRSLAPTDRLQRRTKENSKVFGCIKG